MHKKPASQTNQPESPATVQPEPQPEWRELGQDEEIARGDEVAHSKLQNWAPVTDSVWLTPTAYPCLKFRRRVEPAPQPAQTAGDHRQMLIAACRKALEAIDAIPHGQTIRPSSTRHALREAWLTCRDALQDIRTVDVEHTQPCSRCAELERERDRAFEETRRLCMLDEEAITAAVESGCGDYVTTAEVIRAVAKERDALQSKLTEAEQANSALMTSMNKASKFALEPEKNQAARIERLEVALREITKCASELCDAMVGQGTAGAVDGDREDKAHSELCAAIEQANAALAGGKP